MYCMLNIVAVNTYKIYATGYGVRDVQQCTTGEILKVVEKDCILLTKVFFCVEARQESHEKTCFGAEVSKSSLLQSLEMDFGNYMDGYSV